MYPYVLVDASTRHVVDRATGDGLSRYDPHCLLHLSRSGASHAETQKDSPLPQRCQKERTLGDALDEAARRSGEAATASNRQSLDVTRATVGVGSALAYSMAQMPAVMATHTSVTRLTQTRVARGIMAPVRVDVC